MLIRRETAVDAGTIRAVTCAAFARPGAPAKTPIEVTLVDDLRASEAWLPALSLVATGTDGEAIGHVLCTRGRVDATLDVDLSASSATARAATAAASSGTGRCPGWPAPRPGRAAHVPGPRSRVHASVSARHGRSVRLRRRLRPGRAPHRRTPRPGPGRTVTSPAGRAGRQRPCASGPALPGSTVVTKGRSVLPCTPRLVSSLWGGRRIG